MGHEHHYAVSQGNLSKELLELASWNDLKLVKKIKMADYLSPVDTNN